MRPEADPADLPDRVLQLAAQHADNVNTHREYTRVRGLRLRYLQAGSGQRPAVILLHGIGVTADYWRPNLTALAAAGFSAYALDLPGFGESDPADRLSTPEHVADLLAEWVSELGIAPAGVIGHSMGGAFGLAFAARHHPLAGHLMAVSPFGVGRYYPLRPRLFTQLILPATIMGLFGWSDWAFRRVLAANFYDPQELSAELFALAKKKHGGRRLAGRWQAIAGLGRDLGLSWQRTRFVRWASENLPRRLAIVWGNQDQVLPVEHAYELKGAIGAAELYIFDRAGHALTLEYAAEFNELAVSFFRQGDG